MFCIKQLVGPCDRQAATDIVNKAVFAYQGHSCSPYSDTLLQKQYAARAKHRLIELTTWRQFTVVMSPHILLELSPFFLNQCTKRISCVDKTHVLAKVSAAYRAMQGTFDDLHLVRKKTLHGTPFMSVCMIIA
jgi:hypothetical protein